MRLPALSLMTLLAAAPGCDGTSRDPGAGGPATGRESAPRPGAGVPDLPSELRAAASAAASGAQPPVPSGAAAGAPPASASPPYAGPWLYVTAVGAGIFEEPSFDSRKLGYARSGSRLRIEADVVSKKSCAQGWSKVVDGGFACRNMGTTEATHPQVKFAVRPPALSEPLPYSYARNAKHGTPLYKSVPSREQMLRYEPYLDKKRASAAASGDPVPAAPPSAAPRGSASAAAPADSSRTLEPPPAASDAPPAASDAPPPPPWWQRSHDEKVDVTLEQLAAESDDILDRRMVTGFYVAIDRTFRWNDRTWYKTTRGLVAPADRMWLTAATKFQGVELGGADGAALPVAFTYGGRKTAPAYTFDAERKTPKPARAFEVPTALPLTGEELEIGGIRYLETRAGPWVKSIHVRVARDPAPPADLAEGERWIDVNLTTQTLVVLDGRRALYATLVSSGKSSTVQAKDHRTPTGEYRVREKHVTTTMDGNGTVAGDLPYSIEDVPYVMYYQGSYAIHAAFWHRNFGVQMSHGCVNLAPLDARRVFELTTPAVPEGWHGAWSEPKRPGARIVIHD
ncbi:MAG: L,D-transpeptidase [Polyangiaceae bacterium]|nr:L,D-transpeptidase [Polyangiaceae bacterium]